MQGNENNAASVCRARYLPVARPTPARRSAVGYEWRVGAKRFYAVRPEGFADLIEFIEGFWRPRLRRLKQAAEAVERKKTTK